MRRIVTLATLVSFLAACSKDPPASAEPAAATPTPAAGSEAPTGGETTDAAPAELPAAEQVLEEAVVALGGREKLDAIKSFYSESKMEISAQNLKGEIKTWWKGGDFHIENEMDGVGLSQVWKKGDEIWADDPISGRRKLEGKEARQTRWGASVSLAADWKDHFTKAETVGIRTEGDTKLVDVKLTDAEGTEVTLSFDATTHLPIEQSFMQETPMGNLPIRTTMSDYRDVGGVKTSFQSTTSMAIVTAVQTIEKFEPNVDIDEAKFVPPKAKAGKGGAKAPAKAKAAPAKAAPAK
jgi:hypothetical protein